VSPIIDTRTFKIVCTSEKVLHIESKCGKFLPESEINFPAAERQGITAELRGIRPKGRGIRPNHLLKSISKII
jgi:hypothetical protein